MELLQYGFFTLLLLLFGPVATKANSCPRECSCFGGSGSWIVDCSRRNLDGIPAGISENTTELFLQNNLITSLPTNIFENLTKLEFLYLHVNMISNVDATAFHGPAGTLKYLTLGQNEITSLPDEVFTRMNSLKVLNLNDNKLTTIEAGLFRDLDELVQISFCNNRLTSVDELTFNGLRNLRYVGLSQNNLKKVPDLLGNDATSMYLVDYGENQLEKLPKVSPTTRQVYATGNKIKSLSPDSFENASAMYELFLSDNDIELIEEDTFTGAISLGWLDLSFNQLSAVDDVMFNNLSNLFGLYLEENRPLKYISKNAFHPFRHSVYRLSMDNCSLSWLDGTTISMLTNSNLYIWAGDNPWTCDCSLQNFSDVVAQQAKHFYDLDKIMCSAPRDLIGYSLRNVSTILQTKSCAPVRVNTAAMAASLGAVIALMVVGIVLFFFYKSRTEKERRSSAAGNQKWTPAKPSSVIET